MFVKQYTKWCDVQRFTDILNYHGVYFELIAPCVGICHVKLPAITPGNIHAVAAAMLDPKHIDHPSFGSDLYIKVTDQSREIIEHLNPKSLLSQFIDNIDGELWYDLPFCYNPAIRTEE